MSVFYRDGCLDIETENAPAWHYAHGYLKPMCLHLTAWFNHDLFYDITSWVIVTVRQIDRWLIETHMDKLTQQV